MELNEFFVQNPRLAIGFSGGVDSAYLLYEAVKHGCDVLPIYVKSCFQPQFEHDDVKRIAEFLGIEVTVIEADPLLVPEIRMNPAKRCYYCKQHIFGAIKETALSRGYHLLADGTNASDDASDRPGMQALAELSVCSPLRECGLTKTAIREKLKAAGLFVWNKPGYSCLATRIPTDTPITNEALGAIEQAETALMELGFEDFRIRHMGDLARLELPADQHAKAIREHELIYQKLTPCFKTIVMDLKPRKRGL